DPYRDGRRPIEADRPGIAIAVGGTGLEGDLAANAVLGHRRAEEHIAHLPGGRLVEEPARLGILGAVLGAPDERQRVAAARQSGIEGCEIDEPDARTAEADREPGWRIFRQCQLDTGIPEARQKPLRP